MKRRASRPVGQRSPQASFHDGVFRAQRARCLMCVAYPVDAETRAARPTAFDWLQAAHVIAKRDLMGDDKADARNGIVLCCFHHARHDHHVERVPRELLPAAAFAVGYSRSSSQSRPDSATNANAAAGSSSRGTRST